MDEAPLQHWDVSIELPKPSRRVSPSGKRGRRLWVANGTASDTPAREQWTYVRSAVALQPMAGAAERLHANGSVVWSPQVRQLDSAVWLRRPVRQHESAVRLRL